MLTRDTKVEELERQLKNQHDENKLLKDKLSSLDKQREYLLDKVERLHADKHKLEDRLSVVESNQVSFSYFYVELVVHKILYFECGKNIKCVSYEILVEILKYYKHYEILPNIEVMYTVVRERVI